MNSDTFDLQSVKLNGKNYELWAFEFRLLIQGKSLLPYLDGTITKPSLTAEAISIESSEKASDKKAASTVDLDTWETNNARVFGWIVRSVDPAIALTLRTFTCAADVWLHLKNTYYQINTSRVFEVEYEIARLMQGDMDINSLHLAAKTLWTEQDILSSSLLTSTASAEIRQERHRSRVLQFLMKLRPEFESVRSQLIQVNITDMETVLGDLSRAETRLKTQAHIDGRSLNGGFVFAAQSGRPSYNQTRPNFSGYTPTSPRPPSSFMSPTKLKCRHCGENGHVVGTCRKRNFCNYCKKPGHIITECRKRAFRNNTNQPFSGGYSSHSGHGSQIGSNLRGAAYSANSVAPSDTSLVASMGIQAADIQSMVLQAIQQALPTALTNAFATFGTAGIPSPWNLDSACFNHMTGNASSLSNYRLIRHAAVQLANGARIPIVGIGDLQTPRFTLRDILHVPSLVPNLVSVG
ncbi:hypothetical protein LINPERHAP2_LOCUS421 [Linum perenne]